MYSTVTHKIIEHANLMNPLQMSEAKMARQLSEAVNLYDHTAHDVPQSPKPFSHDE